MFKYLYKRFLFHFLYIVDNCFDKKINWGLICTLEEIDLYSCIYKPVQEDILITSTKPLLGYTIDKILLK